MGKKGYKHTEAAKKKISEANKKRAPPSYKTRQKLSDALKGNTRSKGKPKPPRTEEWRYKQSDAHKGKTLTPEHRCKISKAQQGKMHTDETRKKMSAAQKGRTISEEHRRRMSAAKQGIPYDKWESFAHEKKYCPKFNDACKESNRMKYGRKCFICGKTEKANGQKLSVHHVDMQKSQGCESNWMLVPLCRSCHSKAHNDELIARLGYLLKRRSWYR